MSKFQKNSLLHSINLFVLFLLINSINTNVVVKAGSEINITCDRNIYYILIDVVFSEKPPKELYPFTLYLASPEKLSLKCMLDYNKAKIYCMRSFSDEVDLIEEGTYFQFPYPFPDIEDITWDYETFLDKVYRRVWNAKSICGNENVFNTTDINYKKWQMEGSLTSLNNGNCVPASISNADIHKYNFDMIVSLSEGEIIDLLKNNKDNEIEILQEIWVPLLPREEKKAKKKSIERSFPFAYCLPSEKVTQTNYQNYKLNCYIPIQQSTIFNGVIRMSSFFDKLYIKQGNKASIVTIYINISGLEGKTYVSLDETDSGIICPNQPVFDIESKNAIMMGLYYNETNKYTFFLTGTLSNGYYAFKNGTTYKLNETYKDVTFNLVVQDNFKDLEESDVNVTCVLPNGSPYDVRNGANIKCIGTKEATSNQNNNVDITLNWNLKANNNFNQLIISWPKSHDVNKKNIYGYELTGLSIRQTNYGCHNNNFDFYVYIYDLGREPKLTFNLPLTSPKSTNANCQIFDSTALKCSINLKHQKLSKGSKVMLPSMGTETEIFTDEGNTIIFAMNNFSEINNDNDFYVKTKEDCGDYLVVGTLKDMGMSHGTSVAVYIIIIVFICLFIAGGIIYILYKLKLRYKRGRKLTASEDTRNSTGVSANNSVTH